MHDKTNYKKMLNASAKIFIKKKLNVLGLALVQWINVRLYLQTDIYLLMKGQARNVCLFVFNKVNKDFGILFVANCRRFLFV